MEKKRYIKFKVWRSNQISNKMLRKISIGSFIVRLRQHAIMYNIPRHVKEKNGNLSIKLYLSIVTVLLSATLSKKDHLEIIYIVESPHLTWIPSMNKVIASIQNVRHSLFNNSWWIVLHKAVCKNKFEIGSAHLANQNQF